MARDLLDGDPFMTPSTDGLAARIRAEYLEMPGLQLTVPQARRLFGLDGPMCDGILQELVATHFLRRTDHDMYVLDAALC